MIFKTKRYTSNNKLFLSFSGVVLICSLSLLLLINLINSTEWFVRKNVSSNKKLDSMNSKSTISKDCYQRTNNDDIDYLEDVLDLTPTTGKHIFFHETTCSRSGMVYLNSRQACAIESAARLHPERNVYVLFASPVGFRSRNVSNVPKNIELLKTYSNIHWRNNNLWKYAKDSPLEVWLSDSDGTLFESAYFRQHIPDVLRYLTLYKFGGICLDVVVPRTIDDLGQNIARDDSDDAIGCGVLQFGSNQSTGEECLRFLLNKFAVQVFVDTGTLDYTRTLERLCETKNGTLMTREQCGGSTLCLS